MEHHTKFVLRISEMLQDEMRNIVKNHTMSAEQKSVAFSDLTHKIDLALYELKNKAAEIRTKLTSTQADTRALEAQIRQKKDELTRLRADVTQSASVAGVRKEQAASLAQKDSANYASSVWLGLERPLKETSHMGLLVAGIAFFLVALATLVFAIRTHIIPFPGFGGGGGGTNTFDQAAAFIGGGWRKWRNL